MTMQRCPLCGAANSLDVGYCDICLCQLTLKRQQWAPGLFEQQAARAKRKTKTVFNWPLFTWDVFRAVLVCCAIATIVYGAFFAPVFLGLE
jgi:hypothetical protein